MKIKIKHQNKLKHSCIQTTNNGKLNLYNMNAFALWIERKNMKIKLATLLL